MERLFLIANNWMLNEDHLNSLNINPENDICFLFNTLYPLQFNIIKNIKHKYIFLRISQHDFIGFDNFIINQNHFQKAFFIDGKECYENINHLINIPHVNISTNTPDMIEPFKINNTHLDKAPSTGFFACIYAKLYFSSYTPILVGFTGHDPCGLDTHGEYHNYNHEHEYYQINNIQTIFNTKSELGYSENFVFEDLAVDTQLSFTSLQPSRNNGM